jgi:alkanesulfonate monooxygenase
MRFGVWAAVHGNRGALQDPEEPYDASWERNKALVLEAEAIGYDATLVAQHTMNPYDNSLDQLEAWSSSAALAAITKSIEIIAAIKPGLYHPVVLAKMASQIEIISKGRFAINLVNAWNKAEFARAGLPFPHHDDRYAYGREWIEIVKRLLTGERVNFRGRFFTIDDYILRPADPYRARPRIYLGGESEPARALVADHGDGWFINGQPIEDVKSLIHDVARRPRVGVPVSFGLSAFVIARETEAEAHTAYERLLALSDEDAPLRSTKRPDVDQNVVMYQATAKSPRVGTNGGTAAELVGNYDQVAERIAAFHRAGIELFMLQFQPFEAEMRRFAQEVMPRAKALAHRRAA